MHSLKNLTNRLRSISLGESALVTYSVKQLASDSQLGHDIVFVLAIPSATDIDQATACPSNDVPWTRTSRQIGQCADGVAFVT
jgi:hypothetical protein